MRANYLFTSESVSEGHPDKVADQISDAIVDLFLSKDPESRVACETLTTTQKVVLAGEIRCNPMFDEERWPEHGGWAPGARDEIEQAVRGVVRDIGYEQSGFHWAQLEFDNHLWRQHPGGARGADRRRLARVIEAAARHHVRRGRAAQHKRLTARGKRPAFHVGTAAQSFELGDRRGHPGARQCALEPVAQLPIRLAHSPFVSQVARIIQPSRAAVPTIRGTGCLPRTHKTRLFAMD